MNLKSKIISLVIIFTVFVSGSAYSQGFFKNEKTTTSGGTSTDNGVLRNGAQPGDPSAGDASSSPVGEGLAILSLLSGGYFMLKRRNSKR
jgi:hypothetical protein